MNRKLAKNIVEDYFKAWIDQDKDLFLTLLHDEVVVYECTGDTYLNKNIAEKWFIGWHAEGNKVLSWDIFEHFYDEENQTATVTWVFKCCYHSNEYTFEGSTILNFKNDLIIKLSEYQMNVEKKHPYGVESD